ncbi:MAG: hypothetical protein MJZ74_09960 [Muribaculaceae bacterium]|nr:hypothetical protein [Muribaculaceae bacterium]
MAQKILGFDLGTSSIGTALRNPDIEGSFIEQLEYFSSDIFKAGASKDKSGAPASFAAERTKHVQTRRLNDTRRRRLWATLEVLVEHDLCPLSQEGLHAWKTYNKAEGLYRKYPKEEAFEQWIHLDFNGDGVSDYSSPYQLRSELMERQFDFTKKTERHRLGRALYHIAQRRGFKSSKGETIAEQEKETAKKTSAIEAIDVSVEMKKSETKLSGMITEFMSEHGLKTVGQAFAMLEKAGERLRNNPKYKAVRSQYMQEIEEIFNFQQGLDEKGELHERIISTKKGIGTIFFKNPLKSQKGNVGNCTLEPNKTRCAISHPSFEKFRAWSLLNNIKVKMSIDGDWQELPLDVKKKIYDDFFTSRVKTDFKFKELRGKIEAMMGMHFDSDPKHRTINYKDTQSVSGCPVTARLKNLLGDDWETIEIKGDKTRTAHGNNHGLEQHQVTYTALDLWNVCFNVDDPEELDEFADKRLHWDDDKKSQLKRLWASMSQGYAMLSLKAINNINHMLEQGLLYPDAVMLAKVPEIAGISSTNIAPILRQYNKMKPRVRKERLTTSIANSLIATYKSLSYEEKFAHKDSKYTLQDSDFLDIERHVIDIVGNNTWANMDADEQTEIFDRVTQLYQQFFASDKRDYYKIPKIETAFKEAMAIAFPQVDPQKWDKLYHHSQITPYQPVKNMSEERSEWRLGSPNLGSIKNPVALRVLNVLKRKVNSMLDAGMIAPDDTRIVVETTRMLNDANMRWAIEQYQRLREEENKEIKKRLEEMFPKRNISDSDIDMARYGLEQTDNELMEFKSNHSFSKLVKKYKLWMEQGFTCFYTGKLISFSALFNEGEVDIEHTIPRSKSFDNSDANLTLCDAHYNRAIKKNRIPTELPNYDKPARIDDIEYNAIKPNLDNWKEKIDHLQANVDFWKSQSRKAQTKDRKDHCIRQRHLWQMEMEYWRNKLERFTTTEIKQGFRNSQLVDTGVIARHAVLYLKSVFTNVEVQKGEVTACFRKMLGIQEMDTKKDRDLHSHHAIDAATLTAIPIAAKRDRMLELYFRLCEARDGGHDYSLEQRALEQERRSCHLNGDIAAVAKHIEDNILVNHHSKDRALTSCRRRARVRGKVITVIDRNGNKKEMWKAGDSIRGRLHQESFYAAITQNMQGVEANSIKQNDIKYAIRRPLKFKASPSDSGFSSWDDLEKNIVDKSLFGIIRNQYGTDCSFKEACNNDFFMMDNKGNKVNKIRHVRCFASLTSPLPIKTQQYTSTKWYKQEYYAGMGDLHSICQYTHLDKCSYTVYSLLEVALRKKEGISPIPLKRIIKNLEYTLSAVIKTGDMMLLYNEDIDELYTNDISFLSQRLYKVVGFESDGRITLSRHLIAFKEKGNKIKDFINLPSTIRCSASKLKFLLQGRDFIIQNGKIQFIND